MKVNLKQEVKNLNGVTVMQGGKRRMITKPDGTKEGVIDEDGQPVIDGAKPLTIGATCVEALMSSSEEDAKMGGEEKVKLYKLAVKISDFLKTEEEILDLGLDEAKLVRERVAKFYGPLVVGQVWELIG